MNSLTDRLFELGEEDFADFTARTIPNVERELFIGVRTPAIRALAKEVSGTEEANVFISQLPHRYFEENQLHSLIISREMDFDRSIALIDRFLPYVDNWATCDQLSPVSFSKNKERLVPVVFGWLESEHLYTRRFGVKTLMNFFLDSDFDSRYPEAVAKLCCGEYYMNMMIAWYFATALAKQFDAVIPFITDQRLSVWVHNKTIQKCVESRRITDEQKEFLRTLRIK